MRTLNVGACFAVVMFLCGARGVAAQESVSQDAAIEASAAGEATTNRSDRLEVELDTSEGKILIELNQEKAPNTVANFLEYVESGFYENTVFHRVIDGFMIQGGGLDKNLREKETRSPILNEAGNGLANKKYTVAMARTMDPHSATCQFFINVADNPDLDPVDGRPGYAVFGRVVNGLDVVDKIAKSETYSRPNPAFPAMLMRDVPATPIVIKSVQLRGKEAN